MHLKELVTADQFSGAVLLARGGSQYAGAAQRFDNIRAGSRYS